MSSHRQRLNTQEISERNLKIAVVLNLALTVAEIIGGIASSSLALVADALHNLSDAGALVIAWVALRISKKDPDSSKTFGYRRAELVGAVINLLTLFLIGLFLIYEALFRFYDPSQTRGGVMMIVALIALAIDGITVFLTYSSKKSLNIRAILLHNISDALTTVAVLIAGGLILLYNWDSIDTILTLLIASYVIYQALSELPKAIHILMEGTPEGVRISEIAGAVNDIEGVHQCHHIHAWQIDEENNALEMHIVIDDLSRMEAIKQEVKARLHECFQIEHTTLEFESLQSVKPV